MTRERRDAERHGGETGKRIDEMGDHAESRSICEGPTEYYKNGEEKQCCSDDVYRI